MICMGISMRRIGLILTVIAVTAIILVFPSLYYLKTDKELNSYQKENIYEFNSVSDISLEKEIELLIDEDSQYMKQNVDESFLELPEQIEMKTQLQNIAGITLDNDIIEQAKYKKVKVVNSSLYNVYSIDLGIWYIDWDIQVYMIYNINKRKILWLSVTDITQSQHYWWKEWKSSLYEVEKYYDTYQNWDFKIVENCLTLYGCNERKLMIIQERLQNIFFNDTQNGIGEGEYG